MGLSPRVRGNRQGCARPDTLRGSIPAGAGEPRALALAMATLAVYPRGCGGTLFNLPRRLNPEGLSPRVRGNQVDHRQTAKCRRSIPAGAGEPPRKPGRKPSPRVYPRGCGGTLNTAVLMVFSSGLSPRVRGNPITRCRPRRSSGSIPEGAGEPKAGIRQPPVPQVYPRGCGGTSRAFSTPSLAVGLSPRVRGNRLWEGQLDGYMRSIPAGAGEPYA